MKLASLLVPALLLFASSPATATLPRGAVPPRQIEGGLDRGHQPAATVGGAWALDRNPAGLLEASPWAPLLGLEWVRSEDGGGGFGASLALPLADWLVPGVGLQWLDDSSWLSPRPSRKASLGLAMGSEQVSLGLTRNYFLSDNEDLDAKSLDLGLRLSPSPRVALAAVLRNGEEPLLGMGDASVPGSAQLGLSLRPFAGPGMEFSGDGLFARRVQDDGLDFLEARLGLRLRPLRGLELFGSLGLDGDGLSSATLGLALRQEVLGLGADAGIATASDARDRVGTTALRVELLRPSDEALFPLRRGRVLEVELSGGLPERPSASLMGPGRPGLLDTLLALDRLAQDPRYDGLLLRVQGFEASWAKLEELRAALLRLKAAGKKVWVHLEECGTRGYYLASAADRITISPGGALMLTGIAAQFSYLADTLAEAKVKAEFVRIGRYKSAPDLFVASEMSPAQREMEEALLEDLWGLLLESLAEGRHWDLERARASVDGGPYGAPESLAAGLTDEVIHYSELRERLREDGHRLVDKGLAALAPLPRGWGQAPRVAVIDIEGTIAPGRSSRVPLLGEEVAGADSLAHALDRAAKDDGVRAIVLRISSPGGSATASELIHHHVRKAAESKPVVVSLGTVAASGGYYVAAPGTVVFTDRASITGSIGIFAGKFDLSGLFGALRVRRETLKRGRFADLLSSDRGFTEEERDRIKVRLQRSYDLFVERVASGRKLTPARVEELAQGRVWTGKQAQAQGLADRVGGWYEALGEARRLAGLAPDAPLTLERQPAGDGLGLSLGAAAAALAGPPAADPGLEALMQLTPLAPLRTLARVALLSTLGPGPMALMDPQLDLP